MRATEDKILCIYNNINHRSHQTSRTHRQFDCALEKLDRSSLSTADNEKLGNRKMLASKTISNGNELRRSACHQIATFRQMG